MIFYVHKKQLILWSLCLLCILGGIGYSYVYPAISVANTDWGLHFSKEGEVPGGNATGAFLKQYDAYYVGDTGEKTIYLTFDAGFENGCTEPILDALAKHNAKATFFLVGNYLETAPDLVKRMVEEGHTVGNHTYHHPDMAQIANPEAFAGELTALEEKYREIVGQELPKLYRPPQGKYREENLKQAQQLGYHTIFWSLAYVDWYADRQPTAEQAFQKLLPRIHPGAIVLLHSTSQTNAAILDELLTKWEQAGYTFGNLLDVIQEGQSTTPPEPPEQSDNTQKP